MCAERIRERKKASLFVRQKKFEGRREIEDKEIKEERSSSMERGGERERERGFKREVKTIF